MVEEELISQLYSERCVLSVGGLLVRLGHALEVVGQSLQSPHQLVLTNLLIDLDKVTLTLSSGLTEFECYLSTPRRVGHSHDGHPYLQCSAFSRGRVPSPHKI